MAAFLFSCNQNAAKEKGKSNLLPSIKPKIEVRLVGEVLTRKSYASIQFMEDQKEIDAYLEKQYASNPTVAYESDSISKYLISQFERLGLIKNGEILLKNFKKQTDEKTTYSDSSGQEVSIIFFHSLVTDHYHFKLSSATDSVKIDTGGTNLQNLDYAFMDVIPGGNKELVFLDDYHIMNGDNFDFMVYEIKINN
jgi:hypothetical protein